MLSNPAASPITAIPEAEPPALPMPAGHEGAIEIEFATGSRMQITDTIDAATLTAVVAILSNGWDNPTDIAAGAHIQAEGRPIRSVQLVARFQSLEERARSGSLASLTVHYMQHRSAAIQDLQVWLTARAGDNDRSGVALRTRFRPMSSKSKSGVTPPLDPWGR